MNNDFLDRLCSKVTAYRIIQKRRIAIRNAIYAFNHRDQYRKKRGFPPINLASDETELLKAVFGDLSIAVEGLIGKEKALQEEIARMGKETPLWVEWLQYVKGMGPFTAGILTALFWRKWDRKPFKHRSSLKKYIGWIVDDKTGKFLRKTRGVQGSSNFSIRPLFWRIGKNLKLAKGDYYYQYYLPQREIVIKSHPEMVLPEGKSWDDFPNGKKHPGHIDKIATIKMVNLFISHLWEVFKRLKEPLAKIPPPMHRPDKPLKPNEYIPPIKDKVPKRTNNKKR